MNKTDLETEKSRLRECIAVGDHLARALTAAGHAMEALLSGVDKPFRRNKNDPDGPTDSEIDGFWYADRLEQCARRALKLHRIGDGPAPADFARACIAYASALRVAASGRWPEGVEEVEAELRQALQDEAADARLTARGTLRGHDVDVAELSATGPTGARLAGRIQHECRHALSELRRIAGTGSATL